MISKAGKLRGKLGNFAKEREEFEAKKKKLQEQMEREKENMGKIRKGLRRNDLKIYSPDADDVIDDEHGARRTKVSKSKKTVSEGSMTPTMEIPLKMPPISTGPKLSDWAYTGTVDSSPPVIKHQELYEEVRFLGRGAYGTVDLVKNKDNNLLYASKTLLLQSKSEEAEFMHEVQFLRANRHPFIIHLHDVFITTNPKKISIIMHYCGGGDLGKVIALADKSNTPIPENQILKWIGQIGLAIAYIHSFNIAHRDIKPVNVLLSDNGEVAQLADFGLATELSSGPEKSSAEVGTPYYTSPEMIRNEPCTLASDAWSFGVLLFEALSMQLPFVGANTVDLVRSILTDPPRMPVLPYGVYSLEINDIIEGLLIKDPMVRFTVGDALKHDALRNRVGALPSLYRPKHLEERLRRYHARQIMHQLDELGIRSLQSPSSTRAIVGGASQKPHLETLESGVEFDSQVCVAHHSDPFHTSTSSSSSILDSGTFLQLHPRQVLVETQSSTTSVMVGDGPSQLLNASPNASMYSETHLPPDGGDQTMQDVQNLANERGRMNGGGCDYVTDDIRKHGVNAIDHASKYLQKLKHSRDSIDGGSEKFSVSESAGEHENAEVHGGRCVALSSLSGLSQLLSPRPSTNTSMNPTSNDEISTYDASMVRAAAPSELENRRHIGEDVLVPVSTCSTPKPPYANNSDLMFPVRSKSDSLAAFILDGDGDSSSDQIHSPPFLPMLGPFVSSRPSSSTSPQHSGTFTSRQMSSRTPTVSLFSARHSSPRPSKAAEPNMPPYYIPEANEMIVSREVVKDIAQNVVAEAVEVEVEASGGNIYTPVVSDCWTVDTVGISPL